MWICPCLHLPCKVQRDSGPASNWACAPQFPSGAAGGVIYEVIRAPQHTRLDAACTPIIILYIYATNLFPYDLTWNNWCCCCLSILAPVNLCVCVWPGQNWEQQQQPAADDDDLRLEGGHLTVQKVACSPLRLIGAFALNRCLFWCSFVSLLWLYWTRSNPLV